MALAALESGCAGKPEFIGYLTVRPDVVATQLERTNFSDRAVLNRSQPSNLLDLRIGGPLADGMLSSSIRNAFLVSILFSTDIDLPGETPEIFIPILNSHHFELLAGTLTISKRGIQLNIAADRLGVDLIYSSIAAPGGIQGVAYFPAAHRSIPLDAQALRNDFSWATLSKRTGLFGQTCFGVENKSEYVFAVWDVTFSDGSKQSFNREIAPFTEEWRCFRSDAALNGSVKAVSKSRIVSVPGVLVDRYNQR